MSATSELLQLLPVLIAVHPILKCCQKTLLNRDYADSTYGSTASLQSQHTIDNQGVMNEGHLYSADRNIWDRDMCIHSSLCLWPHFSISQHFQLHLHRQIICQGTSGD